MVRTCGIAFLLVVGGLPLALILEPLVPGVTLAVFLIAVSAATWYGGLGPGLAATALAGLAIDYYFEPPYGSLVMTSSHSAGSGDICVGSHRYWWSE